MPLLSLIEAANKIGWSIELLQYLTKNCPKHGETRTLPFKMVEDNIHIEETDLINYQRYLLEKWPIPKGQKRPPMRDAITEDVRAESHYGCAICGDGNHGEVAHINAAANGACNSPDNLLFLCPNHHTAYDHGHKVSSNVRREVVESVKIIKRDSRRRMLLYETNAAKAMRHLIQQIKKFEEGLKKEDAADLKEVSMTEMKALMSQVAKASDKANADAQKDIEHSPIEIELTKIAPKIAALANDAAKASTEYELRQSASQVVAASDKIIIDLGEVECPHCAGSGQRGLAGSLCSYCGGACYVPTESAEAYDEDEIDEVDCPRCGGRCQTGWVGDLCEYCKGDGFVTEDEAKNYDPHDMDEVECPRCGGNGQVGWAGTLCSVCGGSCFIPREESENYNPDDLDEVDCPRCSGKGQTGWTRNLCVYCCGDGFVTKDQFEAFNPDELDEVDCPRCNGSGQIGWSGSPCRFCKGDCYVSRERAASYDPDRLDEVNCPRCGGSGQTGLVGDCCKLCKGDCVVSHATAEAYRQQYEWRF